MMIVCPYVTQSVRCRKQHIIELDGAPCKTVNCGKRKSREGSFREQTGKRKTRVIAQSPILK